jgi:hypothetical protein
MMWTDQGLAAFRQQLQAWMVDLDLDERGLEELLGYNSQGYLVRMYLGVLPSSRPPSARFLARLKRAGFSDNGNLRPATFPHQVYSITSGVVAVADLPVGTVIFGTPRQCPECVAEAEEGLRPRARTYYVYAHPCQKYCSTEHRRAWHRRQRRAARERHASGRREE